jgi:outer membrane protein assembly factor BamA
MSVLRLLCVALALCRAVALVAQPAPVALLLHPVDSLHPTLLADFRPAHQQAASQYYWMLPDSQSAREVAKRLLDYLHTRARLSASIDALDCPSDTCHLYLYSGPALYWTLLQISDSIPRNWLRNVRFSEKNFRNKPLAAPQLLRLQQQLLEQAENNGYPFAALWLDSLRMAPNGRVTAWLMLDKKRRFYQQDIRLSGDLKLPPAYLAHFLGWQKGLPYSRARLLRVRDQLRALPFAEIAGNPGVTFSGQDAVLNLFLQKKRAGRFDFILGLLPQPNSSRLLVTGNINAAFQNTFGIGERFALEFERLRPETQRLEASAAAPYLFGTSFGADGRLNIFRRDSTWVDAYSEIGAQYLLTGGNFLRFFWENRSSSLQTVDTLRIQSTRQLPPNLDLRQNGFGAGLSMTQLDYRFNPRKGWLLWLKSSAGFARILRNNTISTLRTLENPEQTFAYLYDSLALRATRFRLELQLEGYLPLFERSTLKLAFRGQGIFSAQPVYNNEQYRIGGAKVLRGFDEESLFATRYAILTAEIRLLLSQNSYLAAFSDYGYLENVTDRNRIFLRPRGFGAGLNLETQAGIFGISIAVGQRDAGQGVDLRATKFHLGYVSLF